MSRPSSRRQSVVERSHSSPQVTQEQVLFRQHEGGHALHGRELHARWVLMPWDRRLHAWELVSSALLLYTALVLPFRIVFDDSLEAQWDWSSPFTSVDLLVDIFFLLDMAKNARTAYRTVPRSASAVYPKASAKRMLIEMNLIVCEKSRPQGETNRGIQLGDGAPATICDGDDDQDGVGDCDENGQSQEMLVRNNIIMG